MSYEIKRVTRDDDDIRLDKWFTRHYPDVPFRLVQKLLRKGAIRVEGKRAKPSDRVKKGLSIKVPPSIVHMDEGDGPAHKHKKPLRERFSAEDAAYIQSLVIYKDEDVFVLNKPSGLATQGGSKVYKHVDGLLEGLTDRKGQRPKLVHRLDRDTSGALVIARTPQAAARLGHAFKSRDARKYYWAITVPTPQRTEGIIDAPLVKKLTESGEYLMVRDDEEGKQAITYYKVIERAHTKLAWVAFWPKTGRTHQIRAHANLMDTMILGDPKYIFERQDPIDTDAVAEKRLHLHARRIILPHPSGKGILDVTADLPPHMTVTWKNFGFDANDTSDPFEDIAT